MKSKNKIKEKEILNSEEHDEDLEELLEIEDFNTEEIDETEISEIENNPHVIDIQIEKNITSYILLSKIIKWGSFILAFIFFMIGISNNNESFLAWVIVSVSFILSGIIYSMNFEWNAFMLKCLLELKNNK